MRTSAVMMSAKKAYLLCKKPECENSRGVAGVPGTLDDTREREAPRFAVDSPVFLAAISATRLEMYLTYFEREEDDEPALESWLEVEEAPRLCPR